MSRRGLLSVIFAVIVPSGQCDIISFSTYLSLIVPLDTRRCSNRVVSNGLNRRLELFRVANDPRHQWGVRLLENVEPNTFICDINGQIGETSPPLIYPF